MNNSMYDDEDDDSHWDMAKPEYHSSDDILTSGSSGSFSCPECGSYNTASGVYFDECRTCGWGQGY